MILILFSCKDKQGPGMESWFGILNPVQSDSKALSERTYTSDGRITFAKFNSDLVPYSRKQAPEVLKTYLQLPLSFQASFLRSTRVGDFDHDRFQQRYKGIRVENGIYTVVSKENTIELMMGEFHQVPENFNSSPKLSESEALSKTLKHIGAKKYLWEVSEREAALKSKKNDPNASYFPKGELLVYQHSLPKSNSPKEFRLAYKFGITSIDPPSSKYVYVDSNSGEILSSKDARRYEAGGGNTIPSPPQTPPDTNYGICFPDQTPCIKQGSASTRFSGVKTITTWTSGEENHYELKDYSRGKGIITYSWEFIQEPDDTFQFLTVPIVDINNGWTKFEYHDDYNHDALLDAHWGIEMIYDYFKSVHNWLGYDGNDSKVVNNVHYIDLFLANNAFWSPITEEIYYIYCPHNSVCKSFDNSEILDPRYEDFTSLDVTSHEFGHDVNGAIAGLNYDPEPYALNEGFSDIWNIGVNNYVNKVLGMQKNLWLIADETVPGGGMRSVENPKSTTVMYPGPNTYYGDLWDFENNEPHTNSLVLSHWFYTLSKGKLGTNDHHCGYNVSEINIEKAEKIAYAALHYLFPTSGYTSARTAAIYSAKALYGKFSSEVKSTIDAWDAVGVPADTTSRGGQGMYKPHYYITFVNLSNLERSSGNDCRYKDNSYLHPTVIKRFTYNMVLSSEGEISIPSKVHKWRVWIDFNRNGSSGFYQRYTWRNTSKIDSDSNECAYWRYEDESFYEVCGFLGSISAC